MNQLLLVRSPLSGTTDETLARCVNVRKACLILHARGGANLTDHLSRDLNPSDALDLSRGLRAFVESETKSRYFRSYRKLLQEDDSDEIVHTALWLKRAARAGCRIWCHAYDDGDDFCRIDATPKSIIMPFRIAPFVDHHGSSSSDETSS